MVNGAATLNVCHRDDQRVVDSKHGRWIEQLSEWACEQPVHVQQVTALQESERMEKTPLAGYPGKSGINQAPATAQITNAAGSACRDSDAKIKGIERSIDKAVEQTGSENRAECATFDNQRGLTANQDVITRVSRRDKDTGKDAL